jgi:hypothetical protein
MILFFVAQRSEVIVFDNSEQACGNIEVTPTTAMNPLTHNKQSTQPRNYDISCLETFLRS